MAKQTIRRGFIVLLILQNLEIEREQIYGNCVFSGEILLHARQEGLREEEPGDPEVWRCVVVIPILK